MTDQKANEETKEALGMKKEKNKSRKYLKILEEKVMAKTSKGTVEREEKNQKDIELHKMKVKSIFKTKGKTAAFKEKEKESKQSKGKIIHHMIRKCILIKGGGGIT